MSTASFLIGSAGSLAMQKGLLNPIPNSAIFALAAVGVLLALTVFQAKLWNWDWFHARRRRRVAATAVVWVAFFALLRPAYKFMNPPVRPVVEFRVDGVKVTNGVELLLGDNLQHELLVTNTSDFVLDRVTVKFQTTMEKQFYSAPGWGDIGFANLNEHGNRVGAVPVFARELPLVLADGYSHGMPFITLSTNTPPHKWRMKISADVPGLKSESVDFHILK